MHRHIVDQPLSFPDDNRCRIIITLEGKREIALPPANGCVKCASRGETVLIPAAGQPALLDPQPHAIVLEVFW